MERVRGKKVPLTVTIDADQDLKINIISENSMRAKSSIVREAIKTYLDNFDWSQYYGIDNSLHNPFDD